MRFGKMEIRERGWISEHKSKNKLIQFKKLKVTVLPGTIRTAISKHKKNATGK